MLLLGKERIWSLPPEPPLGTRIPEGMFYLGLGAELGDLGGPLEEQGLKEIS